MGQSEGPMTSHSPKAYEGYVIRPQLAHFLSIIREKIWKLRQIILQNSFLGFESRTKMNVAILI